MVFGFYLFVSPSGFSFWPQKLNQLIYFKSTWIYIYIFFLILMGSSLSSQMVKNQASIQETRVQSLGWEDPLEKGMATHSSSLAWRIPWTEELATVQSMWWQTVRHNWAAMCYALSCLSRNYFNICLIISLIWKRILDHKNFQS